MRDPYETAAERIERFFRWCIVALVVALVIVLASACAAREAMEAAGITGDALEEVTGTAQALDRQAGVLATRLSDRADALEAAAVWRSEHPDEPLPDQHATVIEEAATGTREDAGTVSSMRADTRNMLTNLRVATDANDVTQGAVEQDAVIQDAASKVTFGMSDVLTGGIGTLLLGGALVGARKLRTKIAKKRLDRITNPDRYDAPPPVTDANTTQTTPQNGGTNDA